MLTKTTKITATSRVSVKIRDNFYTVEFSEERTIPDDTKISEDMLEQERNNLWDDVNKTVDNQVEEIVKTFS